MFLRAVAILVLCSVSLYPVSAEGDPGASDTKNGSVLENADIPAETVRNRSISTGRDEIYAIARSFPDRIEAIEKRDGDWSVRIDGRWFGWSNGRMLLEGDTSDWKHYISYWLYDYPLTLPEFRELSEDEAKRVAAIVHEIEKTPLVRAETYMAALLRANDRRETEEQLVRIEFLGFRFRTHSVIAEPLRRVEEELVRLIANDGQARTFFEGVRTAESYNYRPIAGQTARSYHSYGIAIDFIPESYGGKFAYWRWARDIGVEQWWQIPYDERWMIPESIVHVFERHGFVWGGKWLFFDTMHFEYRPEILLLSRLGLIGSTR